MIYKSFYSYLKEGVEKYLVWEPTGIYKDIVSKLDTLQSQPNELYRGASKDEISVLKQFNSVQSKGTGNTRKNAGTYVSEDIHLAGAFALRYFKEGNGGFIIVLDRNKLGQVTQRDPGNYTVDVIPMDAVKRIIDLNDFVRK